MYICLRKYVPETHRACFRDSKQPRKLNKYLRSQSSRSFTINANSGQITTVQALDYETQNQYLLIVEAADGAIDRRSSTVTVTIQVLDVEDNVPVFVRTLYEVSVPENSNTALVTTVTVSCVLSVRGARWGEG